jgi:hypothetical protein
MKRIIPPPLPPEPPTPPLAITSKPKRHGIEPKFDEDMVAAMLAMPCTIGTSHETRTASAVAVVDGADRRITHESMIELTNTAFLLNETLRQADMIHKVIWDLNKGVITTTYLKESEDKYLVQAEKHRLKLLELFKLVKEMPGEETTIS